MYYVGRKTARSSDQNTHLSVEIEEILEVPGDHLFKELVVAKSLVEEVIESVFEVEQRLDVSDGIL